MDLYKNWDFYVKQYNIDKFYDVDKKFLKELTNFLYSFAKYFNTVEVINKLEKSVDNLQIVDLKFENWKLLDKNTVINKIDNKYYFTIWKEYPIKKWKLKMIPLVNEIGIDLINEWIKIQPVYRWDDSNKPKEPIINEETGKIFFGLILIIKILVLFY